MANNVDRFGYASIQHLFADRLNPQNQPLVLDAIRQRAAIYSMMTMEMLAALAVRTERSTERFALPGYGTLQPLDALGVPLPVRPAGHTDVAYPIYGGGTAAGRDRVSRALETVEDVFRDQEDAEARDATWLKWHVLAALFTNTARNFVDVSVPEAPTIVVQPLAITSDSVTYVRNNGTSSTAQHYVAQAAAIADATNPFTAIHTLLAAYPGNAGRDIVSFVPSANVAAVEALATFIPVADPDVRLGSASDILVAPGGGLRMMGDRVLGKVGMVWVVEWSSLPDNYLLNVVDGRPPLAMREYPDAALQGFFPEIHSPDGARIERRFLRYCGFGVRNRVAASVTFVGAGDTTYDIPTGYTAPQAV
jgi:hypothetical protein